MEPRVSQIVLVYPPGHSHGVWDQWLVKRNGACIATACLREKLPEYYQRMMAVIDMAETSSDGSKGIASLGAKMKSGKYAIRVWLPKDEHSSPTGVPTWPAHTQQ